MTKRIAIYATVPDGTDPSEVLESITEHFEVFYNTNDDASNVCVEDPYTGGN